MFRQPTPFKSYAKFTPKNAPYFYTLHIADPQERSHAFNCGAIYARQKRVAKYLKMYRDTIKTVFICSQSLLLRLLRVWAHKRNRAATLTDSAPFLGANGIRIPRLWPRPLPYEPQFLFSWVRLQFCVSFSPPSRTRSENVIRPISTFPIGRFFGVEAHRYYQDDHSECNRLGGWWIGGQPPHVSSWYT